MWARTVSGKLMPLDAAPDPAGNVEAVANPRGGAVLEVVAVHKGPDLFGAVRYMPHFQSCPNAEDWRGSRGR